MKSFRQRILKIQKIKSNGKVFTNTISNQYHFYYWFIHSKHSSLMKSTEHLENRTKAKQQLLDLSPVPSKRQSNTLFNQILKTKKRKLSRSLSGEVFKCLKNKLINSKNSAVLIMKIIRFNYADFKAPLYQDSKQNISHSGKGKTW